MSGRLLSAVAVAAAMAVVPASAGAATPPMQSSSQSVTATGTGQARVTPTNRNNDASIVAAVDAAHVAAISGALSQAHEYASDYAQAAGLTLGAIQSVSDVQQNSGFYASGPGVFYGPFGPNRYCGTITRILGRPVKGHKPKFRKVHRCLVPGFAYTTLTVTYAAS